MISQMPKPHLKANMFLRVPLWVTSPTLFHLDPSESHQDTELRIHFFVEIVLRIEFFSSKTLRPPSCIRVQKMRRWRKGEVVELVLVAVEYEKECYAALFFKCLHEFYLVGMDVCEGKVSVAHSLASKHMGIPVLLQCSLRCFAVRSMPGWYDGFLCPFGRGDGCWDFLNECKFFFSVLFVGAVYEVFQCGAS